MRKFVSLLALLFITCFFSQALATGPTVPEDKPRRSYLRGDVLDVDLREAGTLKEYLLPTEENRVRCIRLTGVMNGDDANFIRKICNRAKAYDENEHSVDNYVDLELERVRIVGGGSFMNRSEHDVISNSMFNGCHGLRYVSLPRDLRRIGNDAFSNCTKLEEVRFVGRSNVREIGSEAFRNCYKLTRINLPEGLEVIGNQCFYSCNALRRIDLPYSLREIGKEAFYDVPITDIRLPNGLTFLGSKAFKDTKLVSLYLPRDLQVENNSFGSMPNLKEFQVERGNKYYTTEDGVLYDATGEILIYYPQAKSGSFSVPSGVTTLLEASFAGSASLTSISFPNSLTEIGPNAFNNCSSLTNIVIPENVTSLGKCAFSYCKRLTSVSINGNISTLNAQTFENCSSLQSIVLPQSLVTIGEKCFNECKSLQHIEWCNSLKTIMKEAFRKCGFLQIEVPNSVTVIGENAFRDCKSMNSIILPNNLAVVEKELFRGCENLLKVTLPEYASIIGENAFRDCKSLPTIELPEGLTTINNNAFRGTALNQLELPASMLKIGDKIVEKCKMQSITCHAIVPPNLSKVSDKKTPLYVPGSSIETYKNAKPWKDFKNIQPIE